MMRRTSMLIVMAALFVFPARSWAQGSKGKVTPPPPGACQVTLRDLAGDVIRSDNGQPYVNGVGGVVCTVDLDHGDRPLQLALLAVLVHQEPTVHPVPGPGT
jgi:hypothetical protein